jgi:hypothetical protein
MLDRVVRAARAGAWLALALAAVTLPARAVGPFRTPLEITAETCRKAALELHPGKIESTAVLYGEKSIRIEVHIKQNDGKGWIVLCDGASGKIVSTIDVDAP